MQTDIKAQYCPAGPTLAYADRTRLRSLTVTYRSSAEGAYASVIVYDSKKLITDPYTQDPVLFIFEAPFVDGAIHILFPGQGILAKNGLSVVCSSSKIAGMAATVTYG